MPRPVKIDFVSDISCPWCVIGLRGLEEAMARVGDLVDVDIHFQPFELNPDMAPGGDLLGPRLAAKYGMSPEAQAEGREMLRGRGAALGFAFNNDDQSRLYNTFDAHRLIHWAGIAGHQHALKKAIFTAYFTGQQSPEDHDILVGCAEEVGLSGTEAREVLASGRYAAEVRDAEALWRSRGINSVPAIIFDDRYLISGGQPPEAFEQALRQLAAESA